MAFSESDTRVKLIGGKRGERYFVDYLLSFKNTNSAIVEAKAEKVDPLEGLQQVINYTFKLKIDMVGLTATPKRTSLLAKTILTQISKVNKTIVFLREPTTYPRYESRHERRKE